MLPSVCISRPTGVSAPIVAVGLAVVAHVVDDRALPFLGDRRLQHGGEDPVEIDRLGPAQARLYRRSPVKS
jgi:hypothetical protein